MPRGKLKLDRYEVYLLLTGQHPTADYVQIPASRITAMKGVSKTAVSLIIKDFILKGLIEEVGKGSRPKFYRCTHRDFFAVYKNESKLSDTAIECTNDSPVEVYSPVLYEMQKAEYKCRIQREYIDFWSSQNTCHYRRGNCLCFKYRVKVFDEMGEWIFEKQGRDTLLVIAPGIIVDRSRLVSSRQVLFNITFEALKWFQKHAHIRIDFGSLCLIKKPHLTRPAKSSKAVRVGRNFSLNIDGRMLDASSGNVDWEIESDGVYDDEMVDVIDALESWDWLRRLTQELEILKSVDDDTRLAIAGLKGVVDEHSVKIREIMGVIDGVDSKMNMISGSSTPADVDIYYIQ